MPRADAEALAAGGRSLLDWRDEQIGVAVCFEVVFPGETAELVREGATLLATVTNDAWYGATAAPRQHLPAARFRAAETRRWLSVLFVTTTWLACRPCDCRSRDPIP